MSKSHDRSYMMVDQTHLQKRSSDLDQNKTRVMELQEVPFAQAKQAVRVEAMVAIWEAMMVNF